MELSFIETFSGLQRLFCVIPLREVLNLNYPLDVHLGLCFIYSYTKWLDDEVIASLPLPYQEGKRNLLLLRLEFFFQFFIFSFFLFFLFYLLLLTYV